MSYEEKILAKRKFMKSMSEEEIDEPEMVDDLMYILNACIINYKEFEEVQNNKNFNKNLIHILNKYYEELGSDRLFDLFDLVNDYDFHKNIFNIFSENLSILDKKYLLDYIMERSYDPVFSYGKKELIGLYNDEIIKSINDEEIRIDLYNKIIIDLYMENNINNQLKLKYYDIELIVDDINKIGIHKIVNTFEDLLRNIHFSKNININGIENEYIGVEEFDKYLYLKNNFKGINNLTLNIYDSECKIRDYMKDYFNKIELYELIANDFINKDKLAENKLKYMYETTYSRLKHNIFVELYLEKINYKMDSENLYFLDMFRDRALSLPNIHIENLIYNDKIEDEIDYLVEKSNVIDVIKSMLNITNDNQNDIYKYIKEKYSDEVSNYKKELIENNDLLTLELFDKKFNNELDKDIKIVRKRKMF